MNPWQWWTPAQIAVATGCPEAAVNTNWPAIAAALEAVGCYDRANALGALGTIAIETASTFAPVREAFWCSEDWRREYLRYHPFFGRGYIQLTWESNYEAAGTALGVDLVGDPDLALEPEIAARVLAWYWASHGVRAKDGSRWYSLPDLCREGDWEWVRRVVQGGTVGLDRLREIVAALDAIKEPGGPMPLPIYLHTTDTVNLREQPTVESAIVVQVAPQTVVEGADEHAWRRVRLADGTEGWMAADLLDLSFGQPQTVQISNKVTAPQLAFNAATPTELQVQDWTCSIRSTMWMLKSIGIDVTPAEAQDAMSPRYVTPSVGLLDASGAGIVQVLSDRWHVAAFNRNPVSFDEVAAQAGHLPVAIGGRSWGHWVAVRGFDGERLVLANPGGTGPRYGQQTLDRGQFAALGPFSMVVVTGRV